MVQREQRDGARDQQTGHQEPVDHVSLGLGGRACLLRPLDRRTVLGDASGSQQEREREAEGRLDSRRGRGGRCEQQAVRRQEGEISRRFSSTASVGNSFRKT